MEYTISAREKKWQRNLPYQLWRVIVLSVRFITLTRLGSVEKVGSENRLDDSVRLSTAPR
jgi:hypothetical protein